MPFRLSFLLILFALVCGAGRAAAQQTGAPETPADASVKLKGLDGKIYDTTQMPGQVLVVSFGATWCTPCTWELVAIEELKVEYEKKPVKFLWVTIEDEKMTSNNILRHYVKERRMTIPVLRDSDQVAFSQFSTSTRIPLVVFFDREGRYVAPVHRGMPQDISEYKKLVRSRVDALLGPTGGSTASKTAK